MAGLDARPRHPPRRVHRTRHPGSHPLAPGGDLTHARQQVGAEATGPNRAP